MIQRFKPADHDAWLELRKHYIGGSDAGAVMGMSAYKGPFALWAEKTGRVDDFNGSITTETGTYLEPFVAKLFERETGKRVRRDNFTMVNDLYPWACADVDRRIIGEDALLECKTTTSMPNIKKFAAGEYPETWYCQMTHYLAVTGCKRIYLAVLINCREFKWFTLDRNQAEIDALMDVEQDFWKHVTDDVPPAAGAQDGDAINAAYPAENKDLPRLDLTGDLSLLEEYESAQAEAKAATERANALKQQICGLMGEHEYGACDDYKVRWTTVVSNRFDQKALAAAHPEIDLSPYYKASSARRFDFTRITK